MFRRTVLAATAVLAVTAGLPTLAQAKDAWPTKTITLVQPYAPGGTSDMLARIVAIELEKRVDASVIVESKPGANGNIATAFVSRAKPDGGTFLVGSSSPVVISPSLYKSVPYNPKTDLTPITPIAKAPFLLVTGATSGIKSVDELVAQIKSGKLNFGSAGAGSPQHIIAEMFHMHIKAKSPHVPYKGSAPLIIALMANEVQYGIDNPVPLKPQIDGGKLRALAITSATRSPQLPDVPTMAEAGLPGYEISGWFGVLVPAATPKPIVERLNQELLAVLAMPDVREQIAAMGGIVVADGPAGFGRYIASETDKWGALVRSAQIKVQ